MSWAEIPCRFYEAQRKLHNEKASMVEIGESLPDLGERRCRRRNGSMLQCLTCRRAIGLAQMKLQVKADKVGVKTDAQAAKGEVAGCQRLGESQVHRLCFD